MEVSQVRNPEVIPLPRPLDMVDLQSVSQVSNGAILRGCTTAVPPNWRNPPIILIDPSNNRMSQNRIKHRHRIRALKWLSTLCTDQYLGANSVTLKFKLTHRCKPFSHIRVGRQSNMPLCLISRANIHGIVWWIELIFSVVNWPWLASRISLQSNPIPYPEREFLLDFVFTMIIADSTDQLGYMWPPVAWGSEPQWLRWHYLGGKTQTQIQILPIIQHNFSPPVP